MTSMSSFVQMLRKPAGWGGFLVRYVWEASAI